MSLFTKIVIVHEQEPTLKSLNTKSKYGKHTNQTHKPQPKLIVKAYC